MKRFLLTAALALLLLTGCGDDGFLHGSAPVKVTDTSSAIEANGRFRCNAFLAAASQSVAADEFDRVVQIDGRLTNTIQARASFVATLTILSADQSVTVEREWVMPPGFTSETLTFGSNDKVLSGRENLQKVVGPAPRIKPIERCDLTIR